MRFRHRRILTLQRGIRVQRTTPSPRPNEAGSSLIELVIGSAAVLTLIVASMTCVIGQTSLRRENEQQYLAMQACRNNLEMVRGLSFSTVPTLDGTGFDVPGPDGDPGGLTPIGNPTNLVGSFAVATDKSSSGETLYRVTLSVDWKGLSGAHHFEISSLVAERKSE